MSGWMIEASRLYFNSDFPLSFLKTYEAGCLARRDYLDVLDRKIKTEEIGLITSRNNRPRFEKICEEHNSWIKPFGEMLERTEHDQITLMWYVDLLIAILLKNSINQNRLD